MTGFLRGVSSFEIIMFSLNEDTIRHVHLQEVLGFVGLVGNAIGEQAISSTKCYGDMWANAFSVEYEDR